MPGSSGGNFRTGRTFDVSVSCDVEIGATYDSSRSGITGCGVGGNEIFFQLTFGFVELRGTFVGYGDPSDPNHIGVFLQTLSPDNVNIVSQTNNAAWIVSSPLPDGPRTYQYSIDTVFQGLAYEYKVVSSMGDRNRELPDDELRYGLEFNPRTVIEITTRFLVVETGGEKVTVYRLRTSSGFGNAGFSSISVSGGSSECFSPAHISVTNIDLGEGIGQAVSYSNTVGDSTLTCAPDSISYINTGSGNGAGFSLFSNAQTLMPRDFLVTKMFDADFGSDVTIDDIRSGFPPTQITLPDGALTDVEDCTVKQLSWNGATIFDADGHLTHEYALNGGWIATNGVDSTEDHIWLLDDASWPVTTFTHAASFEVDGFSSVAGWTGTNATLGSAPGLEITATDEGAGASRSSYGKDFRNYRYLRVNAACNAGAVGRTVTVTAEGRQYQFTLDQEAAKDYDLDLCLPVGTSGGTTDETLSAWSTPGDLYGPTTVNSFSFGGLEDGDVLTVNSLTLVRKGATFPGLVMPEQSPATPDSHIGWWYVPDAGNTQRRVRLLRDFADGKPGADIYHAIRTLGGSDSNLVLSSERRSINEFIAAVNAVGNGIGASAAAELASATGRSPSLGPNYYGGGRFAAYLTLDGSGEGELASWGADMTSRALYAWPGYRRVTFYHGMTGVTLRFVKRLYGLVAGLVLTPSGPAVGEEVTISGGLTPTETATTDSDGFFLSGPRSTLLEQNFAARGVSVPQKLVDRRVGWGGLVLPGEAGEGISYDVSDAGRQALAYIQDGTIWLSVSRDIEATDWDSYDTGLVGDAPCIRYERGSAAQALWIVYADGGAVVARRSETEGRTWGSMTTIFSAGENPTLYYSRQNTLHFFCRTSDGKIKGKVLDAFGNVVLPEFEAVSSGVDDGSIGAWGFFEADGTHRVHLLYTSSGAVVLKASTNGRDFS